MGKFIFKAGKHTLLLFIIQGCSCGTSELMDIDQPKASDLSESPSHEFAESEDKAADAEGPNIELPREPERQCYGIEGENIDCPDLPDEEPIEAIDPKLPEECLLELNSAGGAEGFLKTYAPKTIDRTLNFAFNTDNYPDQLILKIQDDIVFDSGCVSSQGLPSVGFEAVATINVQTIVPAGKELTIEVSANCDGSTESTRWYLLSSCDGRCSGAMPEELQIPELLTRQMNDDASVRYAIETLPKMVLCTCPLIPSTQCTDEEGPWERHNNMTVSAQCGNELLYNENHLSYQMCIDACQSNADCPSSNRSYCNIDTGECEACTTDSHCMDPEQPFCGEENRCTECRDRFDCSGYEKCDSAGQCVDCLVDADCSGGLRCWGGTCQDVECIYHSDCGDSCENVCFNAQCQVSPERCTSGGDDNSADHSG